MNRAIRLGLYLFAISVALLGIQQLAYGDFVQGPFIAPSWLPGRTFWAYLSGLALVVTALGLAVMKETRLPATALAILLAVMLLTFHLPAPLAILRDGVARTRALETLAMGAVALVLAGAPFVAAGRLLFAFSVVVFGVQHFMYADFVAAVVPSWIPGPLAWAYITGVAMIAAGVSLATGIQARLAAMLLGLMFLLWVVLLHVPRAVAQQANEKEWNSTAVALAMCGAAWILAPVAGKPEPALAASPPAAGGTAPDGTR